MKLRVVWTALAFFASMGQAVCECVRIVPGGDCLPEANAKPSPSDAVGCMDDQCPPGTFKIPDTVKPARSNLRQSAAIPEIPKAFDTRKPVQGQNKVTQRAQASPAGGAPSTSCFSILSQGGDLYSHYAVYKNACGVCAKVNIETFSSCSGSHYLWVTMQPGGTYRANIQGYGCQLSIRIANIVSCN